jgi:hypothetical protein
MGCLGVVTRSATRVGLVQKGFAFGTQDLVQRRLPDVLQCISARPDAMAGKNEEMGSVSGPAAVLTKGTVGPTGAWRWATMGGDGRFSVRPATGSRF